VALVIFTVIIMGLATAPSTSGWPKHWIMATPPTDAHRIIQVVRDARRFVLVVHR
jgi:hypothetical protein